MKEDILLCGKDQSLVGILTTPDAPVDDPALPVVIMVNAGLIHRVGPNRIYVKIARALAVEGFRVLRLDLSGIGDSMPRLDNLPIQERVLADVRDAMDTLTRTYGAQRFILMGHCSGAMFSLLLASQEPRVTAAVLINPEGGSDEWEAFDRQRKEATYYANFYGRSAVMNRERLRRFLTGKADYRTIAHNIFRYVLWNRLSAVAFRVRTRLNKHLPVAAPSVTEEEAQARAVLCAAGERAPLLFIHTEGSTGYEHVRTIAGDDIDRLRAAGRVRVTIIPETDHIYTLLASQQRLVEVIQEWITETMPCRQPAEYIVKGVADLSVTLTNENLKVV